MASHCEWPRLTRSPLIKPVRIYVLLLLSIILPVSQSLAGQSAKRPNIVIILADDLGYGDVQCLNPEGKIRTANMDRLAASGMRFTDAHSASAVCTPTRYGLLTGRYCWRTNLQSGVLGGLSPRLIEPGRETVASLLKSAGYFTGCIGKWHLGMDWTVKPGRAVTALGIEPRDQVFNVDYTKTIKNGPNTVGFEYYFGISASLDMVPYSYIENDRLAADPIEDRDFPLHPNKAPRTRQGPAAPGFDAAEVLPTLIRTAMDFIERRAESPGTPFFLYLPLSSPHTPIAPAPEWNGRSGLGPYADFVMQTDHAIGEVLTALDKHKLADNTLVIVTSDNGCSPQADFPALLGQGHNPNYKFRGAKADVYDGGHHVPFFVRWPGVVRSGSTSDRLVCLNDIFRTCMAAAGVDVPDNAGEDSFSFVPILRGERSNDLRTAIVHHSINGSFAVRAGQWKLCLCPDSGGWSPPRPNIDDTSKLPPVQLFNLADDVGEQTNLHDKHPEIVNQLTALLERYVAEGRSTPGTPQKNDIVIRLRKTGD